MCKIDPALSYALEENLNSIALLSNNTVRSTSLHLRLQLNLKLQSYTGYNFQCAIPFSLMRDSNSREIKKNRKTEDVVSVTSKDPRNSREGKIETSIRPALLVSFFLFPEQVRSRSR